MPYVENLDFLNLNTLRNFPLKEGVDRTSTTSGVAFVIPNDFLVDLSLAASADPTKRFYISELINHTDQVTLTLMDDSSVALGSFVIPVSAHTLYKDYYLIPSAGYVGATGKLTVGTLTGLQSTLTGTFTFAITSTEVEMRTIVPYQGSISRFHFINADGTNFSLTGNVTFVARANVKFRLSDGNVVNIDAGDGLGLNAPCTTVAPPIRFINNVGPDANGKISILSNDGCIQITGAASNTLNITNTCCKPCLGCEEINDLTERAMTIETDMLKLREHYMQMTNLVTQFGTLVGVQCTCS
jgi:hypothetical protein